MNAKKFLAVLVCALMLMQCTVFAADIAPEAIPYVRPEIASVSIDQVDNVVTVTVNTENANNDVPVMVYMYDNEVDGGYDNLFSNFEYSMNAAGYAPVNGSVAVVEVVPRYSEVTGYGIRSGYKEFAVDLYNAGETYFVEDQFVASERVLKNFYNLFTLPQVEEGDRDTKALLEATDSWDAFGAYYAVGAIENTKDVKLTGKDYEELSEEGKQAFADLIENAVNGKAEYVAIRDAGTANAYNLEDYVKEAYLVAAYNNGGFANERLAEIVYTFDETIGFNAADENLYGAIEDKEAIVQIAKTMQATVQNTEELNSVLESAVSVQVINEAYWLNLVNVVAANNELFQIDEDEIEELLDTKKLRNYFCEEFKGTYYSIDEIKAAWDEAYEIAEDKYEDSQKDKGGSGGGGGRVTGGGTVTGNLVSVPIENSENNKDKNVKIEDYYTDMGAYQWASDAILNLTRNEIVSGYGDMTFRPANSVTRAEFMKMVVNVFGLADITATTTFTDVQADSWYYIYVASAEKLGIAQGYGNGLFGVNDPVTRQDAITIVYRAAKLKGLSLDKFTASIDKFVDKDSIAAYAYEAVAALHNAGVYLDASDPTRVDTFEPTRNASRAYLAFVLNQIYMFMNN